MSSVSSSLFLLHVTDPEIRPDPPSSIGTGGRTRCRVLPRLAAFEFGTRPLALGSRVLKNTRCDVLPACVSSRVAAPRRHARVCRCRASIEATQIRAPCRKRGVVSSQKKESYIVSRLLGVTTFRINHPLRVAFALDALFASAEGTVCSTSR